MNGTEEFINPDILKSLSLEQKEKIILSIVNLHNDIKSENKRLSDDHHEVADAIYSILIKGKEVEIRGY